MLLHGVPIQLKVKVQTGENRFGEPIFADDWETVEDVLVGLPSTEDLPAPGELNGRRVDYLLGIPKGDSHDWTDTEVELPAPFGGTYRTVGFPIAGIDDLIPLRWNRKVRVERVE